MMKFKLFKGEHIDEQRENIDEKLEKYFSAWAIEAGEQIDKKAEKEGWDSFDHASAINFMLTDIREDMKTLFRKYLKT